MQDFGRMHVRLQLAPLAVEGHRRDLGYIAALLEQPRRGSGEGGISANAGARSTSDGRPKSGTGRWTNRPHMS